MRDTPPEARPTHRRAARRSESGASAVEFALVLPVLILLLGGIIDFGFIFSQQIALNNAARDAARAGVVQPLTGTARTCSQLTTIARNSLSGGVGMSAAAVTVTPSRSDGVNPCSTTRPCTGAPGGTQLVVQATFASSPPFPVPFLGTVNLRAKGAFQCEYA
ncbi:TadE/TadG family type IV pilus assembly protein [Oryzobacter sp. R7]|uniref:TadE/TadG family type IV pilus assembly protein n=1 Tax=Oryzobacter faecalis TaxID=3388656 RepID=UPI00398D57B9